MFKSKEKFGTIIPIVKCIRYSSNVKNIKTLKEQLIKNMIEELLQYTEFSLENKGDGTQLLSARLDVVKKYDDINLNTEEK